MLQRNIKMIAKDLISIYRVIKMCDRLCCDFPITKCWLICCFFAAAQRSSNSKTWQVDYRSVFRLMARVWTRYSCCQIYSSAPATKKKELILNFHQFQTFIFVVAHHSFFVERYFMLHNNMPKRRRQTK